MIVDNLQNCVNSLAFYSFYHLGLTMLHECFLDRDSLIHDNSISNDNSIYFKIMRLFTKKNTRRCKNGIKLDQDVFAFRMHSIIHPLILGCHINHDWK